MPGNETRSKPEHARGNNYSKSGNGKWDCGAGRFTQPAPLQRGNERQRMHRVSVKDGARVAQKAKVMIS